MQNFPPRCSGIIRWPQAFCKAGDSGLWVVSVRPGTNEETFQQSKDDLQYASALHIFAVSMRGANIYSTPIGSMVELETRVKAEIRRINQESVNNVRDITKLQVNYTTKVDGVYIGNITDYWNLFLLRICSLQLILNESSNTTWHMPSYFARFLKHAVVIWELSLSISASCHMRVLPYALDTVQNLSALCYTKTWYLGLIIQNICSML